jgi:hypothetical protein
MARLSKHGKELLRIARELDITDPTESITWARTTDAYMSDGTVLRKRDVRFKPNPNASWEDKRGELYSWGWKVLGKIKQGIGTPEQVAERRRVEISSKPDSKWKVVSSDIGPAPFVLTTEQVLMAIESGEYVGICKACGNEQEGVEPDARGHKCDKCGMMEVYGAEECLISA